MFRFALDVSHKESQIKAAQYPALAEYIKKLMENHSYHYVISMTQVRMVQPEIENSMQAANALSIMLYPYGWHIKRDGVTIHINTKY